MLSRQIIYLHISDFLKIEMQNILTVSHSRPFGQQKPASEKHIFIFKRLKLTVLDLHIHNLGITPVFLRIYLKPDF